VSAATFFPADLARLAVDTHHDELVVGVWAARSFSPISDRLWDVGGVGGLAGVEGGEDEDLVAPDDGRGGAAAGDGGLPFDVGLSSQVSGGSPSGATPVASGPAPLVPVGELFLRRPGGDRRGQEQAEGDERERFHDDFPPQS